MFGVTLFLKKPFSVVIISTSAQGLNKALFKTFGHPFGLSPIAAWGIYLYDETERNSCRLVSHDA